MTEPSSPIGPPIQAGPARRVLHMLMALAGWSLFVYWWWIVFQRVSSREIRITGLFIAVALVVIVAVTLAWAWHNTRIFKRKGARTHVREATSRFLHDSVGRPVTFRSQSPDPRTAPIIYVRFTEDGKRYDPAASLPPRGASPPAGSGLGG